MRGFLIDPTPCRACHGRGHRLLRRAVCERCKGQGIEPGNDYTLYALTRWGRRRAILRGTQGSVHHVRSLMVAKLVRLIC